MDEETTREPESKGSKEYAVQGFTGVEVSTAIEFDITQSPEFSVKAVGDHSLIKRLKVEVDDEVLKAGLDSGFALFGGLRPNSGLKLAITMPQLRSLAASGACKGTARGFRSSDDFNLELSGASQAGIDIEAGKTTIGVSGAGRLSGVLKAQQTELELSGASRCELSGTGGDTGLDFSGASRADLSGFEIRNLNVDLSGASRAKVKMDGKLNSDLSGASSLEYAGNVVLGKTSTSGASKIRQAS
jgi:hypothetical protein